MATGSVDGLVSGMDTTSIINQLLTLEATGQTALKTRVLTHQTVQKAYQAVNMKMTALQTAAATLTKPDTWRAVKATASSDAVTATATSSASPGSFRFDVTQLAAGETWATTVNATASADVLTGPLV